MPFVLLFNVFFFFDSSRDWCSIACVVRRKEENKCIGWLINTLFAGNWTGQAHRTSDRAQSTSMNRSAGSKTQWRISPSINGSSRWSEIIVSTIDDQQNDWENVFFLQRPDDRVADIACIPLNDYLDHHYGRADEKIYPISQSFKEYLNISLCVKFILFLLCEFIKYKIKSTALTVADGANVHRTNFVVHQIS